MAEFDELKLQVSLVDNASAQLLALKRSLEVEGGSLERLRHHTSQLDEQLRSLIEVVSKTANPKGFLDLAQHIAGGAVSLGGVAISADSLVKTVDDVTKELRALHHTATLTGEDPANLRQIEDAYKRYGRSPADAKKEAESFVLASQGRAFTEGQLKIAREFPREGQLIDELVYKGMREAPDAAQRLNALKKGVQDLFDQISKRGGPGDAELAKRLEQTILKQFGASNAIVIKEIIHSASFAESEALKHQIEQSATYDKNVTALLQNWQKLQNGLTINLADSGLVKTLRQVDSIFDRWVKRVTSEDPPAPPAGAPGTNKPGGFKNSIQLPSWPISPQRFSGGSSYWDDKPSSTNIEDRRTEVDGRINENKVLVNEMKRLNAIITGQEKPIAAQRYGMLTTGNYGGNVGSGDGTGTGAPDGSPPSSNVPGTTPSTPGAPGAPSTTPSGPTTPGATPPTPGPGGMPMPPPGTASATFGGLAGRGAAGGVPGFPGTPSGPALTPEQRKAAGAVAAPPGPAAPDIGEIGRAPPGLPPPGTVPPGSPTSGGIQPQPEAGGAQPPGGGMAGRAGEVSFEGGTGKRSAELDRYLEYAGLSTGLRVQVGHGLESGHARHTAAQPAYDLDLYDAATGRKLDMRDPNDLARYKKFMYESVRGGATGVGAGAVTPGQADVPYMGPSRIHIGGGPQVAWGAGGHGVNAPQWLGDALAQGAKDRLTPAQLQQRIVELRKQQSLQSATGATSTSSDQRKTMLFLQGIESREQGRQDEIVEQMKRVAAARGKEFQMIGGGASANEQERQAREALKNNPNISDITGFSRGGYTARRLGKDFPDRSFSDLGASKGGDDPAFPGVKHLDLPGALANREEEAARRRLDALNAPKKVEGNTDINVTVKRPEMSAEPSPSKPVEMPVHSSGEKAKSGSAAPDGATGGASEHPAAAAN